MAVEAGLSAHVLRPGLAGVLNVGLLCGPLACWLAAVVVLAWLGNSPRPSTVPGQPSTSWISSLIRRIRLSCRGAAYQRSKTLISQSA